jgi:hypothetical protein
MIEDVFTECYPKICSRTEDVRAALRAPNVFYPRLKTALVDHINFNLTA